MAIKLQNETSSTEKADSTKRVSTDCESSKTLIENQSEDKNVIMKFHLKVLQVEEPKKVSFNLKSLRRRVRVTKKERDQRRKDLREKEVKDEVDILKQFQILQQRIGNDDLSGDTLTTGDSHPEKSETLKEIGRDLRRIGDAFDSENTERRQRNIRDGSFSSIIVNVALTFTLPVVALVGLVWCKRG